MINAWTAGLAAVAVAWCAATAPGQSFVNWESAHVHPLDVTPGGERLLAVNTADNRLEMFVITASGDLLHRRSIPVGLDPISVRARTNGEAWVVNKISDSISVVDLAAGNVVGTIPTGDEPGDVVFAAGRAFVSVGTADEVWVYDVPYDPGAPPTVVSIEGEDPRALATDGTTVYAAVFNAGNRTTSLNPALVNDPASNPYAGTPNPPPNDGAGFDPPLNPNLPTPPLGAMILQEDAAGTWRDDQGTVWGGPFPFWTIHGHALAHIDAGTLAVSYTNDLMALNMAIDVSPVNGHVAVVGTTASNVTRFEPNLRGTFAAVNEAIVDPDGGPTVIFRDLNPQVAEFIEQAAGFVPHQGIPHDVLVPPDVVALGIGDPRGVAWSPNGAFRLITGRGSNNLVRVGPNGARQGLIAVGQGPTGVVFATNGLERAYVLNQHGASISTIDTGAFEAIGSISFFDPTPETIRTGRPHLYNTTKSSAFGNVSCATCHVDGANDLLAWDLGDPSAEMKEFNQTCIGGGTICDDTDWHPMKGPMTTQTFFGIIGTEPFHWRGDREDLAAFNPAFDSLLGGPLLSDDEMAQFEAMVASLTFPPNPNRLITNELAPSLPNGGNPANGKFLFDTPPPPPPPNGFAPPEIMGHFTLFGRPPGGGDGDGGPVGGLGCAGCHAGTTGTSTEILRPFFGPGAITQINHLTKVAQLRDLYRKDGFDVTVTEPLSRGTGFLHNGSFDTLLTFLSAFFGGATTEQERLDVQAYLQSFAVDTHAGVGTQATIGGAGSQFALRDQLIAIADAGETGLVAKGLFGGERRGFFYFAANTFASDRAGELLTVAQLDAGTTAESAITYTLVALGTEQRIGVDRDEDGFFDRDELDICSDPADPTSTPQTATCCGDLNGSGGVGFDDILVIIGHWGPCGMCAEDLNDNGTVGFDDILVVIGLWGACGE
ncbi:MAG: hypothetical protein GY715_20840 [Planctomycetes bacterium]|nr:hypothetical protein [Planctomycetota bacterium]